MRFIIYGAGGIGGTIGMRLLQAGTEVVMIARGAHLEAIRERGLELLAPSEQVTCQVDVVGHPRELDCLPDDVVLMCMKSQHMASALEDLRAVAPDEIAVVCAQNGVANERAALRQFANVYAMLVILPGLHLEPGVVVTHADGVGGVLDLGCYPQGVDRRCELIAERIRAAGFSCAADSRVMRSKYAKLLGNLSNSLQAATDMAEGSGEIARMLRREAVACFRAAGIDCATREEMKELYAGGLRYAEVPNVPRGGGSSWQSIARGTGDIESDFLNGEIVLLGRLHGVPTPANEALQALGNEMARTGLGPGSFSPDQVRLRIDAVASSVPSGASPDTL
jgi:2-dehydropantoate 2-reductase